MGDLISRERALVHLRKRLYETALNNVGYVTDASEIYEDVADKRLDVWLNEIRPEEARPERKLGKWEYVQYDGNPKIGNWHCSKCRRIVFPLHSQKQNEKPLYDFCPWCGAKMEDT